MIISKLVNDLSVKRRRAKQRCLEALGMARRTDDSGFKIEYEEYCATMKELKNVYQLFQRQLEAFRINSQASTTLCLHMAHFNKSNTSHQASVDLFNVMERLDVVNANAIAQVYAEKVLGHMDQFLWNESEITTKVAQRQQLLVDLNTYQRKCYNTEQQLELQENSNGNAGGGMFSRRKSEVELQCDLATRKIQLEQAEEAFNAATADLCAHFQKLVEARESGELLMGPMAALYTCQRRVNQVTDAKLGTVKKSFPEFEQYESELLAIERNYENNAPQPELFVSTQNPVSSRPNLLENGLFGVSLAVFQSVPSNVIEDCIELLNEQSSLQTKDIFKQNGSMEVANEYRRLFNEGKQQFLRKLKANAIDVAYLLKLYLRELPEALIPEVFYEHVIASVKNHSESVAKEHLANIMEQIPDHHFEPLLKFLVLLNRIGRRATTPNKDPKAIKPVQNMTFSKLAGAIGQIILRPEVSSPQRLSDDLPYVINAVELMIKEANLYAQGQ